MTSRQPRDTGRRQPPMANFTMHPDGSVEVNRAPDGFDWPPEFDYYAPVLDRTGEIVAHTTYTCTDRRDRR